MNHKRKRPKNKRAGCLMCKANKMNGWSDVKFFHHGWTAFFMQLDGSYKFSDRREVFKKVREYIK